MRSPKSTTDSVARSPSVSPREGERSATHSQELQHGWVQSNLHQATVVLAGAGGLGSAIALESVQAGVGRVVVVEHDIVELSNLHRQLFSVEEIGRPKAGALAQTVAKFGASGSSVIPREEYIQDYLDELAEPPTAIIVGVDNDEARFAAAEYSHERGVPLVNVGLAENGAGLQVIVQEPGGPCLRCFLGDHEPKEAPCGGLPVDCSLCGLAASLATRALFSLLMPGRPRTWNRLTLFPDVGQLAAERVQRRQGCTLCS